MDFSNYFHPITTTACEQRLCLLDSAIAETQILSVLSFMLKINRAHFNGCALNTQMGLINRQLKSNLQ